VGKALDEIVDSNIGIGAHENGHSDVELALASNQLASLIPETMGNLKKLNGLDYSLGLACAGRLMVTSVVKHGVWAGTDALLVLNSPFAQSSLPPP
jgi:hypothetical protein